jgi:hypothetical protein
MCVFYNVCMCGCFGNMFTCIYSVFALFVYFYSYLLLVYGLLPPSEDSIAVNNNNSNNNNNNMLFYFLTT